jgi:hypothetical protein
MAEGVAKSIPVEIKAHFLDEVKVAASKIPKMGSVVNPEKK